MDPAVPIDLGPPEVVPLSDSRWLGRLGGWVPGRVVAGGRVRLVAQPIVIVPFAVVGATRAASLFTWNRDIPRVMHLPSVVLHWSEQNTVTLTVHEVHVLARLRVLQFVGSHPQLHDQLPGPHVRPGDVHLHLGVVDLAHQTIARHIGEVPKWAKPVVHGREADSNQTTEHLQKPWTHNHLCNACLFVNNALCAYICTYIFTHKYLYS